MQQILQESEFLVASHERRLQTFGATSPAALSDDPLCLPRWHGRRLALQRLLAGRLEHDCRGGRAHGRLADEHATGRRHRLEPSCRVDKVARDHALSDSPETDRSLAREDARPRLDARRQAEHPVDQLQPGSNGSFGVVLVCDRRAPDGHDSVAYELLDRATMPLDHVTRDLEVARQDITDRLGIALLSERREADEVRKEHRDQAALGDRGGRWCRYGRATRCRRTGPWQGRGAIPAEPVVGLGGRPAGRAHAAQRTRALDAELPAGFVLGATVRADHAVSRLAPLLPVSLADRRPNEEGSSEYAGGHGAAALCPAPGRLRRRCGVHGLWRGR